RTRYAGAANRTGEGELTRDGVSIAVGGHVRQAGDVDRAGDVDQDSGGAQRLLRQWRDDLASWAIPEHSLRAADQSPWALPPHISARRPRRQVAAPGGPSFQRAVEALAPRGEVLDVGAGTGAASLPLAPWATAITAMDAETEMLESLRVLAADVAVPV